MKRLRFWIFILIRTAANALIISGVLFSLLSFAPFVQLEFKYWWDNSIVRSQEPLKVDEPVGDSPIALPALRETPINTDFSIIIEKIDVNAPVVQNVDSSNYREYMDALAKGVAHAKGTAFPGSTKADNNNVFLFAHSSATLWEAKKYNSVFYLLRKVEVGDRITTFYAGKRYDYIVSDKKVVQSSDTRYLTEPSKDPTLTLQTCDPPGSSLRRLIVTAKLVENTTH